MNARTFLKVLEVRYNGTRRTIAAIPDDRLDFRPTPDMMSARELALHLVGNYVFLTTGLGSGRWATDAFTLLGEYATTESIVAKLDAVHAESLEKLPAVPDAAFDARVRPFGVEQRVAALAQGIADHEHQHRGQLQVYLRLMGVKPPSAYGE